MTTYSPNMTDSGMDPFPGSELPPEYGNSNTDFDETLFREAEGYTDRSIDTSVDGNGNEVGDHEVGNPTGDSEVVVPEDGFPWLFDSNAEGDNTRPVSDQQDECDLMALLRELSLTMARVNQHDAQRPAIDKQLHDRTFSKIARTVRYPEAAKVSGRGPTFIEKFTQSDGNAALRQQHPYFPFNSFEEWEFTGILFRMPCSLNWKTDLLNTQLVSKY
jgi:hypothetical protein